MNYYKKFRFSNNRSKYPLSKNLYIFMFCRLCKIGEIVQRIVNQQFAYACPFFSYFLCTSILLIFYVAIFRLVHSTKFNTMCKQYSPNLVQYTGDQNNTLLSFSRKNKELNVKDSNNLLKSKPIFTVNFRSEQLSSET